MTTNQTLTTRQSQVTGLSACQHAETKGRLVPGGPRAVEILTCDHCGATNRRPVGTPLDTARWSAPTAAAAEALGNDVSRISDTTGL